MGDDVARQIRVDARDHGAGDHRAGFQFQGLTGCARVGQNPGGIFARPTEEGFFIFVGGGIIAVFPHGGQITAFGKWAYTPTEFGKRYLKEWRIEDDVPILVSNGIGCNGFPIRFYAPAEMHLIELSRGPEKIEDLDMGVDISVAARIARG